MEMVDREIPRLLYAIRKDAQSEQGAALGSQFDVEFVYTLHDAINRVATESFDLVLCGIHFDECQMGPLLQHCRTDPSLRNMPFVCIRCIKGVLPDPFYSRTRNFVEAMGAHYLDYQEMVASVGHAEAMARLQADLMCEIDHRKQLEPGQEKHPVPPVMLSGF